jgi:hypothetical protein
MRFWRLSGTGNKWQLGALLGLTIVGLAPRASAFCRTTTCVPQVMSCQMDANNCLTTGLPLFWSDKCITFSMQRDGSRLRNITTNDARRAAEGAFANWLGARCPTGLPSIGVIGIQDVECDVPEYNYDPPAPNANVIMFRDDNWPYTGPDNVIALTTITFDADTGQIFDADIEVNSIGIEVTVTDEPSQVGSDLQSVLTHEVGHLFGLGHSEDSEATMNRAYQPSDLGFRTPNADDQSGICTIYPPDPDFDHEVCPIGTQPRHGFGRVCSKGLVIKTGCSVQPSQKSRFSGDWLTWTALGGLGWMLLRRRSVS